MEKWSDRKNDLIGWYQNSKENNVLVIDYDHDRAHNLYAFKINGVKDVLVILRHVFGLTWDSNCKNPEREDAKKYRGSGVWGWYKEKKTLTFSVDVGCWCSHDCCGHMCGLTYDVSIVGALLIVSEVKCFNF